MATESPSLTMRLPATLRERLGVLAEANDRSLNAEAVARLTQSVEGRAARGLFEALDLPSTVRLRTTSTSSDLARLLTVCTDLDADLVVLGARRDALNGAVLVAIVRTPTITCVMDQASLNLARPPRVAEVRDLFQRLDALDLLQWAHAWPEFVDDTSQMAPADAANTLLRKPRGRLDLPAFLHLLAAGQSLDPQEFRLPRNRTED